MYQMHFQELSMRMVWAGRVGGIGWRQCSSLCELAGLGWNSECGVSPQAEAKAGLGFDTVGFSRRRGWGFSEPEEQGLEYRNSSSLLSVILGCQEVLLMPSHWQGSCPAPPTVMYTVLCKCAFRLGGESYAADHSSMRFAGGVCCSGQLEATSRRRPAAPKQPPTTTPAPSSPRDT